jgi:hypothetical protein
MKTRLALTFISVLAMAAPAMAAKSGGTGYAGFTSTGAPIAIQVSHDGKQITRAGMELSLKCTSGAEVPFPDLYRRVRVSKSGAFKSSFANQPLDLGNGQTAVFSGSLSGKFNRARTKVSGIWHLHFDAKDAAGTVTDQCDSGNTRFSAIQ